MYKPQDGSVGWDVQEPSARHSMDSTPLTVDATKAVSRDPRQQAIHKNVPKPWLHRCRSIVSFLEANQRWCRKDDLFQA
jgi:hypothetical protein